MRRLSFEKVLECFSLSMPPNSCGCLKAFGNHDHDHDLERKPLMRSDVDHIKIKDIIDGTRTLAFHLEPKTVTLRVSMHCGGCAKKIEKHIAKMDGVTSFEIDLENKTVVVVGDITPFEVLESVSKVKFAELMVQ